MQSYNHPSTSWGNPVQPNNTSPHNGGMDPRRLQHRASTSPVAPYIHPAPPSHPRILMPGFAPSTAHRSNLFFTNPPPQMNLPQDVDRAMGSSPPRIPSCTHPQLHHTHSAPPLPPVPEARPPPLPPHPGPQMHRSLTSPPPLPPKPLHHPNALPTLPPKIPFYPPSVPQSPPLSTSPLLPQLTNPTPHILDQTIRDQISTVLPSSESSEQRRLSEELSSQEEEDLARALKESMLSAPAPSSPLISVPAESKVQKYDMQVGSSANAVSWSSVSAPPAPSYPRSAPTSPPASFATADLKDFPRGSRHSPTLTSQMSDDEAFARRLAAEEERDQELPTLDKVSSKATEVQAQSTQSLASGSEPSYLPSYSAHKSQQDNRPSTVPPTIISSISDDEAYARKLAAQEMGELSPKAAEVRANSSALTHELPVLPHSLADRIPAEKSSSFTSPPPSTILDDEAYARRLAAEEEEEMRAQAPPPKANDTRAETPSPVLVSMPIPVPAPAPTPTISVSKLPNLPCYADAVPNSPTPSSLSRTPSHTSTSPSLADTSLPIGSTMMRKSSIGSSVSPASIVENQSPLSRPSTSVPSASSPGVPSPDTASLRPLASLRPNSATSSTPLSIIEGTKENEPVNANQFVDADLLQGVSVGFTAPNMTTRLVPMQAPMPNIISLPYGRSPPLHLQSPNWRHLLKLLARLSGTRVEPTVEAMAVTKTDLQLRTVIQFVKPQHSSPDWRVVLWFTIDHPVPSSMPGAFKYISGDVNTLPWSYTLSNLPTILRDGADSPVSKYYTIPSTESLPYPSLPITFPNLAMYLQTALEESRRYSNDSSSGIRKLAKMIEMCYPSAYEYDDPDTPERTTVGGLFKRVIGRGNKNNKKGRGGNQDTFELVTPFVPDEWG